MCESRLADNTGDFLNENRPADYDESIANLDEKNIMTM